MRGGDRGRVFVIMSIGEKCMLRDGVKKEKNPPKKKKYGRNESHYACHCNFLRRILSWL